VKGKRKTSHSRSRKKQHLGRYKSSLEKYCADQLSEYGISFAYEELEFQLMEPFVFDRKYFKMTSKGKLMSDRTGSKQFPIKYTPDFVGTDYNFIIETKGYLPSHHDFPMRWKLFLRHIMINDLPYELFLAKNKQQVDQAIQEILKSIEDGSN